MEQPITQKGGNSKNQHGGFLKSSKLDRYKVDMVAVDDIIPSPENIEIYGEITADTDPELVPLILGIGMSVHWPVIGWMYGRTAIYTTHSVVRAIACFVVWNRFPEGRFMVLPFSVSGVYLLTVAAIVVASSDVYKARWLKASALAA